MDERKQSRFCSKRTICEVHRQLYDLLVINLTNKNEKLLGECTILLSEAFELGVSLVRSLLDYNLSLPKWKKVENREELKKLRKLRSDIIKSKLRKSL